MGEGQTGRLVYAALTPGPEAQALLKPGDFVEVAVEGAPLADAALVPAVGASKSPGSTVAGRANTLVFPDLASANIGVKLVERLAGGIAYGPFLQGLAKPANDLSRGCSAEDVYGTAIITALQAGGA